VISTWQLILSAAVLAYLVTAAVLAVLQMRRRADWRGPVMRVMIGHALAGNIVVLIWRAWAAGPEEALSHSFDSILLFATLLAGLAAFSPVIGRLGALHVLLLPVAAAVQASAFLTIGEHTVRFAYKPWFITHMASMILGATCFAAGGVAGMAYLWVNRRLRNKRAQPVLGTMPPLESLEVFGRRMVVIGFGLLTFGILTGICGIAHNTEKWRLFAHDPLVIFTVVMWLLYAAALLGLRLKPDLRGRRAAWLAVWSLVLLMFVFVLADVFSQTH
jgi:ABC-type uncharacterized transport system permease subunit